MKRLLFTVLLSLLLGQIFSQKIDTTITIQAAELSYNIFIDDKSTVEHAVFFYEPGANGSFPVGRYKDLASKYSLALIGSNDSKNGPMDISINIMRKVINHAKEHFLKDSVDIYLSGFSGGARTATLHALNDHLIEGVIGCGSGFPPGFNSTLINYKYIGIVGNTDMNYLEMLENEQSLKNQRINSTLIEFHGAHSWPVTSSFDAALSWLFDDSLTYFQSYYNEFGDSLFANNHMVALARVNKRLRSMDLIPKSGADTNAKDFKKQEKELTKIYKQEKDLQNEILNSFSSIKMSQYYEPTNLKTFEWWQSLIGQLMRQEKKEDEKGLSAKRLVRFIGANSFERGYFGLQSNPNVSKEYFRIFDLVSNNSWYSLYWLAKVEAILGNWSEFEHIMRKSVEAGFTNFDALKKDSTLSNATAQDIINQIQTSE